VLGPLGEMSNNLFGIPATPAITTLDKGPCKRYDNLNTAILKNNKVYLLGEYTTRDVISFKNMGFRFNPKHELFAGYEIYLKNRKTLKDKVIESDDLYAYLSSVKDSYDKKSIDKYLNKECPFKLFDFQKEFVYWFNNPEVVNHACLNASSAGVGKTVMTLAAIFAKRKDQPLIIICPRNAVGIWREHLEKFQYSLPIKFSFEPGQCACILTYESLSPLQNEANEKKRSIETFTREIEKSTILVADEFHKTKSSKTKVTKRFRKLFAVVKKKHGKCIALTATPIMNRPSEFKTLLDNLDLLKISFGNSENFYKFFGGSFDFNKKRLVFNHKLRQPEEIKKRVKSILFIKLKEDVIEQLPERIETNISVPIRNKLASQLHELGSPKWLLANTYSPLFTVYTEAREALSLEKIDALNDLLDTYEEIDKPVIVFSCFTKVLREISKRKGWELIDGTTDVIKRSISCAKFNKGQLKGLAISRGSGSTALSISGTDTAISVDLSLTPAINYQCEERINRINSIKNNLHYIYLISDHPFEREMHELIREKEQLRKDTLG
jgi:superfamily II DNA or RNA helicase